MKKSFILMIVITMIFSGCTVIETVKHDYLKADDFDDTTMPTMWETIREKYLRAAPEGMSRSQVIKAELQAHDEILKTEYKDDYRVSTPRIDSNVHMPEAVPFIFIHFDPLYGIPQIVDTTYLVVIRRFNNQIVYSNVFQKPKGDHFYRYYGILREINK